MSEYGLNAITGKIDRIGGGSEEAVVSITTDSGDPIVGPDISIVGQEYKDVPIMETDSTSGDLAIANNAWVSAYVVDPSSDPGEKGTFTTIQEAIDTAFANSDTSVFVTIEIRQSMYNAAETLVFPAGKFHLRAPTPIVPVNGVFDGFFGPGLLLQLIVTIPLGADVTFENISVTNATNPFFSNSGNFSVINGFLQGVASNTATGVFKAFNSYLSVIYMGGGIFQAKDCVILAGNGALQDTTFMFDNCFQVKDGNYLQLLGTSSGTILNSDMYLIGDTTGQIIVNNSTFSSTLNLPNANIVSQPANEGNISNITLVTADYSIQQYDQVLYVNSPTACTIEFLEPSEANVRDGQRWIVKDISFAASTNNITLAVDGAGLINNAATQVINQNGGSVIIRKYDGNYYLE